MTAEPIAGRPEPSPELQSRFASIIERAPLPLVEVRGGAHLVTYVNSAFCHLLGKTRQEIIGHPFADIVPGGAECVPGIDNVYRTGESFTHEQEDASDLDPSYWIHAMWPALAADDGRVGVIIQLTKATNVRQNALAVREALVLSGLRQHELKEAAEDLNIQLHAEIAEHKKADEAKSASETRFRSLFEALPVAAFFCDLEAVIQSYNHLATELWARSPECGVERHCGSVRIFQMDGSELPHPQSPIVEVLRTGRPALNREVFIERPDGSRLPVLVNFAALKDADGAVTGAITCFIDITDRKAAEEALRQAMEEIERGSLAKDHFFAALSHELRTPLTPVLMTATALEGDTSLSLEMREQLGMIRRNIELEARLIDDLLDLTRISRGKLQIAPVAADLHTLLEHTGEIVRSDGFGKQVRIDYELEAQRHHAMADPTRLQQVFWNLIKNALKFTPTGGAITVTTRNDAEGWILVSVSDTGIGIGAEAMPNIFNAFEQGDVAGQHRYGGLGLGLAISRAIVEIHGGAIVAESEGDGCGATFTVSLATVEAPVADARTSFLQSTPAPALRLLIVEDHEATRIVLTRLLMRSGHSTTTVGTVAEALAAYAVEHFDVVISDLGLPDGNGFDLMRTIQKLRPVPAIALSGYGMENDLRLTKEAGFFAHLVKPVNLDQLRLLLTQLPLPPEPK